jgi:hypothetical protein
MHSIILRSTQTTAIHRVMRVGQCARSLRSLQVAGRRRSVAGGRPGDWRLTTAMHQCSITPDSRVPSRQAPDCRSIPVHRRRSGAGGAANSSTWRRDLREVCSSGPCEQLWYNAGSGEAEQKGRRRRGGSLKIWCEKPRPSGGGWRGMRGAKDKNCHVSVH